MQNLANFLAKCSQKIVLAELCKGVHCVDLGESFQTHIYLQNLASIQPRTSPIKFARSSLRQRPRAPASSPSRGARRPVTLLGARGGRAEKYGLRATAAIAFNHIRILCFGVLAEFYPNSIKFGNVRNYQPFCFRHVRLESTTTKPRIITT